jgi:cyclopropane fatty-acyl-phospholipid synthase-like methyltransferase
MLGYGLFGMSDSDKINFHFENADKSYENLMEKLKNYSNKYVDNKEHRGLTSVYIDVYLRNRLEAAASLIPISKKK